ncbi:MAG: hypothetical protein ACOCXD_00415 [Bacteroidota bacterium]
MHQLLNDKLKVFLAEPGVEYKGSRFDWCGYIMQVEYEGNTFCTKNSLTKQPGREGEGLCNEFGIDMPIGYDVANPGEYFPKIGIGLLKKEDNEPYSFEKHYEVIPFETEIKLQENNIRYISRPSEVSGYAFLYQKEISLNENSFTITYTLENTGKKTIQTNEYAHNFISFNHKRIDQDYILELCGGQSEGELVEYIDPESKLRISGNIIAFTGKLQKIIFISLLSDNNISGFRLSLETGRLSIAESLSRPAKKINLWCDVHVISPELYMALNIEPGEKDSWKRTYTFSKNIF